MSRLYDRMMKDWRSGGNYAMHEMLPHVTVVEASNVAAYYATNILEDGKSRMSLSENSTGWLSPFRHTFIEWRPPKGFYPEGAPYHACGWHITVLDREQLRKELEDSDPGGLETINPLFHLYGYSQAADSIRWFCTASLFLEPTKGEVCGPVVSLDYALDYDGEVVTGDNLDEPGANFHVPSQIATNQAEVEEMVRSIAAEWQVVTLAIAFMHCKNVAVDANEPAFKLNKRHRRKYDKDLVTYYTLAIEPMGAVLRRESGGERITAERALHICRGHFAHYSEDKPLFGKYSGTFWKPQHIRGSKKHGEVVKDYTVKPPAIPITNGDSHV